MPHIIALTGKKHSGKTTAANHLISKHGFVLHNFKKAIIEEIKENFPDLLTYFCHLYKAQDLEQLFNEKPVGVRTLMQGYGITRRGDDINYWVDKWLTTLPADNVVVDDLRFVSEWEALQSQGATVVRIIRTDLQSTDTHISETEMDSIVPDHTIEVASGEHEVLYAELNRICG